MFIVPQKCAHAPPALALEVEHVQREDRLQVLVGDDVVVREGVDVPDADGLDELEVPDKHRGRGTVEEHGVLGGGEEVIMPVEGVDEGQLLRKRPAHVPHEGPEGLPGHAPAAVEPVGVAQGDDVVKGVAQEGQANERQERHF